MPCDATPVSGALAKASQDAHHDGDRFVAYALIVCHHAHALQRHEATVRVGIHNLSERGGSGDDTQSSECACAAAARWNARTSALILSMRWRATPPTAAIGGDKESATCGVRLGGSALQKRRPVVLTAACNELGGRRKECRVRRVVGRSFAHRTMALYFS